ncbi:MAG: histidine phosphatase family protein [Pseudomonadota bacterium]
MDILIIRHGVAEDAVPDGNDAQRALTRKGRVHLEESARGLVRLIPRLNVLATSPLVRAIETARILSAAYGNQFVLQTEVLTPGVNNLDVGHWLDSHPADATVALVGHEPGLSQLIGWLTTGTDHSLFCDLKKGGAALVTGKKPLASNRSRLAWLLTPKQLRLMGR